MLLASALVHNHDFVSCLAISTMCMQVMRVVGEGVEYVRANGLARVAVAAAGA